MSSLVYFGSKPSSNALVSEEHRSRGINLCRAVPGSLNIVGTKDFTHPAYELFIDYLPLAVKTCCTGTAQEINNKSPFYAFPGKQVASFCRDPRVVWTYEEKKPGDFIDAQKARFNANETTAGGKPALLSTLSVQQMRDLIKDTSPYTATPISVNTMNISGYVVYRHLHALAHSLCRIFQYALTDKASSLVVDRAASLVVIKDSDVHKPTGWKTNIFKQKSGATFNMNLPVPYTTCNHVISSSADIPNGDGLIFPYIATVARDDPATVPRILSGILNGLHGEDQGENGELLRKLLDGWSGIHITEWGSELTHIYIGIQLAMETGAGIRTFVTPQGRYAGFILTGSFFTVWVDSIPYTPQPFNTLQTDFEKANPHSAALSALLDKVNYPDDITRQDDIKAFRSLYDVAAAIRKYGYNINDQEQMAKNARNISFVKDAYLPLNGTNLARVLTCIASGIGESEIPVHHLAIFRNDKNHRLISAFGASCPSFVIDSGRKMELTGNFSFKKTMKQKGGKQVEVSVNTMYVAVKPFEKACEDLDQVLRDKEVFTIAGTPLAGRVSARAMIKEFDGNHGTEVLAALRAAAKVVVIAGSGGAGKRKADDDLRGGESSKKANTNLFDF